MHLPPPPPSGHVTKKKNLRLPLGRQQLHLISFTRAQRGMSYHLFNITTMTVSFFLFPWGCPVSSLQVSSGRTFTYSICICDCVGSRSFLLFSLALFLTYLRLSACTISTQVGLEFSLSWFKYRLKGGLRKNRFQYVIPIIIFLILQS